MYDMYFIKEQMLLAYVPEAYYGSNLGFLTHDRGLGASQLTTDDQSIPTY